MSTPTQLLPLGYYLGLLTSEYRQSEQMNAWLTSVLNIANDISYCLANMPYAFDLDYAVGVQLDVLGQIAGVSRTVDFQPSGGVSPVLDDTTYRLLIKATIFNNQWDGKVGSLYPFWKTLFAGGSIAIFDHQDMSATVIVTGSFTSIIQDLIVNDYIVPQPQSVGYNYTFGGLPFFGFDRNDAFVSGFDAGKWT
jgi:hypothetical protein